MKIITHPDNLELLKRHCDTEHFGDHGIFGIEIVASRFMERTRKTGRYLLPDGRRVWRKDVRVPDGRFFEWGNSDLEIKLLLEWGLLREEEEPFFLKIDDSLFSFKSLLEPVFKPPKWFLGTCAF